VTTATGHSRVDTQMAPAGGGPDLRSDHHAPDTQEPIVGPDHITDVTHDNFVRPDHGAVDTQHAHVGPDPDLDGQMSIEAQEANAVEAVGPPTTNPPTTPKSSSLGDPLLSALADVLDDLENTRTANANRLRQFTRDIYDADGELRGFGWQHNPDTDIAALAAQHEAIVEGIIMLEKQATKDLERRLRLHPLWPWIKAQKGVGAKQAARLLAVVQDPGWNARDERPRGVAEFWQYCGHGDPARSKRRKGQRVEYSPTAKTRVHLIADSCVRAGVRRLDGAGDRFTPDTRRAITHYGQVYYDRRVTTWGREDWTDIHQHNDALRIVGKALLRDLWRAAQHLHKPGPDHPSVDTHHPNVGPDQLPRDTHPIRVGPDHGSGDTQRSAVGPDHGPPDTHSAFVGPDHPMHDTQLRLVGPDATVGGAL
jgi:hypothetical protein